MSAQTIHKSQKVSKADVVYHYSVRNLRLDLAADCVSSLLYILRLLSNPF